MFNPFVWTLVSLYVVGAILSGLFVLTWFPLALRALMTRERDVSLVRIVDYAGLQLIVFLAFMLILRGFGLHGVTPPPENDSLAVVSRFLLPAMLDVIIALRLWRWGHRLWEARQEGGISEILPEGDGEHSLRRGDEQGS